MSDTPSPNTPPSTFSAVSLALKLGYLIAIPAVVFALLGRFADMKWETSPLFLILGLLLALLSSTLAVIKEIRKIQF